MDHFDEERHAALQRIGVFGKVKLPSFVSHISFKLAWISVTTRGCDCAIADQNPEEVEIRPDDPTVETRRV